MGDTIGDLSTFCRKIQLANSKPIFLYLSLVNNVKLCLICFGSYDLNML